MDSEATYDVFLSYASSDKPAVEELARRLRRRKLKIFLDTRDLVPGEPWQEALEEALKQSRVFVIFLGPSGIRPWQNKEMRTALAIQAQDKGRRVIPVLLPKALMPQEQNLPPFLAQLTWVDFRGGLTDPQALHRLVCGIKGVAPEHGPVSAPSPARPTMIGVPHRNPFFTGREFLLSQLHQQLQAQGITALAQAAIYGLGGIGKTQTAIEYAHRFGEHYRFVLWVVAEEAAAIRSAYLSIARELGLAQAQADLEAAILAVKAWLSREDSWLLVFDNADDPALVRSYLPSTRTSGKVLLTSRAKSFVSVGIRDPFRVDILPPEVAVKFLIERTGNPDVQGAAELADELGYLPLALEQAAAYIETVGGGFAEYLMRYRCKGVALFAKTKPSTDYTKTVATTWTMSFEAVKIKSQASAELLTASAFLVPDSIPIEIFIEGGATLGKKLKRTLRFVDFFVGLWLGRGRTLGVSNILSKALTAAKADELVFWELLEPLERYSLAERLPNRAFKMHRMTQQVINHSLGWRGQVPCLLWVTAALDATYPDFERSNWRICEKLQPHVLQIATLLTDFFSFESHVFILRLLRQAGRFALDRGELAEARKLQEKALECSKGILRYHPYTVEIMNDFALTISALGHHAAARDILETTLVHLRRVAAENHIKVFTQINLASVISASGDYAAARELLEKSLAIQEHEFGAEHPSTLRSRNNLAENLGFLGDLNGARQLQEQNLKVQERVLGVEHPDTLTSRNNLAQSLRFLGDLEAARKLHEQNLAALVGVLGEAHPQTSASRSNLALVLHDLGDLAGARKLEEQILQIRERVLETEHPHTTNSAWNLLQTIRQLNDSNAEAPLIDKLRWLLDRDEDSIQSARQREVRRDLLNLLKPP